MAANVKNNLANLRPDLVAQWAEENGELRPDKFSLGSKQKIWWKCPLDHKWQTSIQARTRAIKPTGCPYCAGKNVWKGFNDLATLHPELIGEWSMMIRTRIKNQECPYCKRFKKQVEREKEQKAYKAFDQFMSEIQENILRFYIDRSGIKMLENSHDQTGIALQFYFTDVNGAIEMPSTHDRKVTGRKVENVKNALCRKNGIKMFRILEADDVEYDDCICIQRKDRSIESYQEALQTAFDLLELEIEVDVKNDWNAIIKSYL